MIRMHPAIRNCSSPISTPRLRADLAMNATSLRNDRGVGMNLRMKVVIAVLSILCLGVAPRAGAETAPKAPKASKTATETKANQKKKETKEIKGSKESKESKDSKFRLKPGAQQKICLTCHADFEEKLKKKFVHTPVLKTGCTACHSPHATNYPKQLAAEPSRICLTCHGGILPKDARSSHKVAVEGKCIQCHDPHSSDNKNNLLKGGNELCYSCHKNKMDAIATVKFKHHPVEKECINCHNPHGSSKAVALLKDAVPALCKGCHQTDKPIFAKQHVNYPVGNSRCTMCHSAHGSDKVGMIYNSAHPPFANKTCQLCHEGPASPNPLALKKKGFELCRGCHNTMVNEMFAADRLHLPVVGKNGCLNCHNPHASSERPLLNKPLIELCGQCHADTIQRQVNSITKHEPITEGQCTTCHAPHSSDNVFLFKQASTIDLCKQCHDYSKHSSHPIGEKVFDKRNKNLSMQCVSCHRAHGTEFKHMLPAATVSDLCTQCHIEFKR
jgi:DmsE family decaheme c-type cytochrome